MIPNLTQEQSDRLKQLIDTPGLAISGVNGISVIRTGFGQFAISLLRDPSKPPQSKGGGSDPFRVKLELDPATATLTGSATTQCGFKYWAYPAATAVVDMVPANRLPDGAASPSRLDYRGHMSVGPYIAAPNGTFGEAFYDGTALRLIAWKELPRAEACT